MHAKYSVGGSFPRLSPPSGILFLTENLRFGGPQTSLANLLRGLAPGRKIVVGLVHGEPLASHRHVLDAAQIPVVSMEGLSNSVDRVESVLNWLDALNIKTLCFWNLGPEMKLMLGKVLALRDIRLIDVSPGPMLFDELAASGDFQKRLAFTGKQYFDRLDAFVAKYAAGVPPLDLCADAAKVHVIPNGVPAWPRFVPLPPPQFMPPSKFDPALAIGTCCRIVPDKRIEFLLEMMAALSPKQPRSSLTIVGGADSLSSDYLDGVLKQVEVADQANIRFVGAQEDVAPFLAQFKIFVMVSERQGCPNAALEAMAMGLPVITNNSGGVAEQIEDGVNGYIVATPAEMADRVLRLQADEALRAKMGRAARDIALQRFSMQAMVERYTGLFDAGL